MTRRNDTTKLFFMELTRWIFMFRMESPIPTPDEYATHVKKR